jgi:putative transposase
MFGDRRGRLEARIAIEDWKLHYNEVRPHSSLGYLTPRQAAQLGQTRLKPEAKFQVTVA